MHSSIFTLLVLVVWLANGTRVSSQDLLRYQQIIASASGSYHADELVSCDSVGGVMTFASRNKLYYISIPERSCSEVETPQNLILNDFFSGTAMDGGLFGTVSALTFKGFFWSRETGVVERPVANIASRVTMAENGPLLQTFTTSFSLDAGQTWKQRSSQTKEASASILRNGIVVTKTITGNDRWYLSLRKLGDSLAPAWKTSMKIVTARLYGADSLFCMSATRLYRSALGDTVFLAIDSLRVNGERRKLNPRYIESLDDGSILYCDATGWYCTIRNMKVENFDTLKLGSTFQYPWQSGNVAYWIENLQDSVKIYKGILTYPPKIEQYAVPHEFQSAVANSEFQSPCFGKYGLTLQLGSTREYLFDLHSTAPSILMYGSILAPVTEGFTPRRMVHAWSDQFQKLHALDDIGNAVTVDSQKVGLLTHPMIPFDRNSTWFSTTTSQPPQGRGWREKGTPLPTRWNSSLVFPGPVIRRFSLDGRLLDTLVRVPVCFASTIDDSILVTGSKGVVRMQTATRFDTTLLASASNIVADTIGYPSSMTRARDGALVLTVLGTSFLHRDSAESVKRRWGGIVRSTNEGKTWTTVSIPSTGSYVMHCARTTSGALVASTMLMVEDSTHPVDVNAPESYYTTSNVEILRSSDNGQTWSIAGSAFYSGPFQPCTGNIIESAPGVLYAATLAGVMISSDDGRTWSTDDQLPSTALPASVSRGFGGILVATTQGVYELPTTTSVPHEVNVKECRPIAVNRVALRQIMQQHNVDQLLLCDINGRIATLTLSSDLAALPLGLYTVLSSDIAAVPSSVLIVE